MTFQELKAYMSLCRLWKQTPTKEGLFRYVKAAREIFVSEEKR